MSVTVCGKGAGYWVQISTPIHVNNPFRSCFTKVPTVPHSDSVRLTKREPTTKGESKRDDIQPLTIILCIEYF